MRVTLNGKTYYLGKFGSEASRRKYDQLIREWVDHGRQLLDDADDLSIAELVEKYVHFARAYYGDSGKRRGVLNNLKPTLRMLVEEYGEDSALTFGPRKLKALQRLWIAEGAARGYVNQHTGRVKRVFKWAVSEEWVPPETLQALATVEGARDAILGRLSAHRNACRPKIGD